MRSRLAWWGSCAVLAILALAMPTVVRAGCRGLASGRPDELLAVPGVNPFSLEWLSPAVRCTAEGDEALPASCDWHTTITRDRMIGTARRLVVASAARPSGERWDYVFVFGCVDGGLASVLHARFHRGAKIVRAGLDAIVVHGSDQPDASTRGNVFYWNERLEKYGL